MTNGLVFTEGFTSVQILCWCGETFCASGTFDEVRAEQVQWEAEHKDHTKSVREPLKVFWLSFCDGDKPKGQQFLGACVVEVTGQEAEDAHLEVLLRFPNAQPGAEWIAAATKKAWSLGCNPGGEIASLEIPADHVMLRHYARGVLMDRTTIERIDADIEAEGQ